MARRKRPEVARHPPADVPRLAHVEEPSRIPDEPVDARPDGQKRDLLPAEPESREVDRLGPLRSLDLLLDLLEAARAAPVEQPIERAAARVEPPAPILLAFFVSVVGRIEFRVFDGSLQGPAVLPAGAGQAQRGLQIEKSFGCGRQGVSLLETMEGPAGGQSGETHRQASFQPGSRPFQPRAIGLYPCELGQPEG